MKQTPFNPLSLLAAILFGFAISLGSPLQAQEKTAAAALDNAKLKTMLENLGYEVKEKKFTGGAVYYSILNKTAALNATIDFSLTDAKKLYVFMDFWDIKPDVEIPNSVLLETLTQNFNTQDVYFMFLDKARKFRLQKAVPNEGITPRHVRSAIEGLTIVASKTQHLWNPNNWPGAKEKAANDNAAEKAKPAEKAEEAKKAEGQ